MTERISVTGGILPWAFEDINRTAEFLANNAEHTYQIAVPLGQTLLSAIIPDYQEDWIWLRTWGRSNLRLRKTQAQPEGELEAITDDASKLDIVARVYDYDDPLFIQGLAKIRSNRGRRDTASIIFDIHPGQELDVADINEHLAEGVDRVHLLLNAALDSARYVVPFAHHSSRSLQLITQAATTDVTLQKRPRS